MRERNRRIPCESLKLFLMRLDEVVDFALNVLLSEVLEDRMVGTVQNIINLLGLLTVDVKFLLFLNSSKNGGS